MLVVCVVHGMNNEAESHHSGAARGYKVLIDTDRFEQELLKYGSSRSVLLDMPIAQVVEHVYSPHYGLLDRVPERKRLIWAREIAAYIEQQRSVEDREAFQQEKSRFVARNKKRKEKKEALQLEMQQEEEENAVNHGKRGY